MHLSTVTTKTIRTFVLVSLCFGGLVLSPVFAQLPSVALRDINGKTVDTSKLNNNGKPFIITFFASWCKPCLRELKAIHEVYPDWQDETGVKVVAVSIDEAQNSARVKPMADSSGWEFEVLLDPNSDFKRALGVNLIPAAFVVDRNGKIVLSRTGYTDGSEKHLIDEVRKLIAEKK
ncbi:MAG: TlpA family protein disulfide reductase [Prevotellaceae bacterium]|jgi:peroxiredoxin|nr:TlpA family protein disulfide reductase [Prevotellaceae bacterium]